MGISAGDLKSKVEMFESIGFSKRHKGRVTLILNYLSTQLDFGKLFGYVNIGTTGLQVGVFSKAMFLMRWKGNDCQLIGLASISSKRKPNQKDFKVDGDNVSYKGTNFEEFSEKTKLKDIIKDLKSSLKVKEVEQSNKVLENKLVKQKLTQENGWDFQSSLPLTLLRFSKGPSSSITYFPDDKLIRARDNNGKSVSETLSTDNISKEGIKEILSKMSPPYPSESMISQFLDFIKSGDKPNPVLSENPTYVGITDEDILNLEKGDRVFLNYGGKNPKVVEKILIDKSDGKYGWMTLDPITEEIYGTVYMTHKEDWSKTLVVKIIKK